LTAGAAHPSEAEASSHAPRLPGWAAFAAIRLGFMLATALTVLWYPEHGSGVTAYAAWGKLPSVFFGTFEHWDADYFIGIAKNGYDRRTAAFMPVYPALVHAGAWVTRSALVAATLVSFAAAVTGVVFVCRIARDLLGSEVAYDTAILLALFPVSLVFTAPYSEGVFLATSAGALYLGTRGRFWSAGGLAAVAVATRSLGPALVPALVVLAWPAVRRRGLLVLAPIVALPLAAVVTVAAYFDHALGDSLAFLHAQHEWGRHPVALGPLDVLWRSAKAAYEGIGTLAGVPSDPGVSGLAIDNVIDFGVLVGAIALTVVAFRRLGLAWGVYSTCLLAIATAAPVTDGGEVLQSLPRFLLVDFPLFIAGASLLRGRPGRSGVTFGVLAAIAAVACVAFSRKLWVA
jgi:hypothetical protein